MCSLFVLWKDKLYYQFYIIVIFGKKEIHSSIKVLKPRGSALNYSKRSRAQLHCLQDDAAVHVSWLCHWIRQVVGSSERATRRIERYQ